MTKTLILLAGITLMAVGAIAFFMNIGWLPRASETIDVGTMTIQFGAIIYPIVILSLGALAAGLLLLIGAIKLE